jgi:aconitase A
LSELSAENSEEFGGITGIFVPDAVTASFINSRRVSQHKNQSHYFRADEGCEYVESYIIDLSKAEPFVARYPNPDDVVPVSEMKQEELDGCFIGACTTAEEDIIMGALVLDAGLRAGKKPVSKGTRKVVPGSMPISDLLRETGLANVYEEAGFEIGVPGCSYCVGMSADMAGKGEVWLSSQNRNFENRMGPGSIAHLGSAATVAASSFDMKILSPQDLIDLISNEKWEKLKGKGSLPSTSLEEPEWVEPAEPDPSTESQAIAAEHTEAGDQHEESSSAQPLERIQSKVFRLGDFIDTDAVRLSYTRPSKTDADLRNSWRPPSIS